MRMEILDPRWSRPLAPEELVGGAGGSRGRGAGQARQVPAVELQRRGVPGAAPAHDRRGAARTEARAGARARAPGLRAEAQRLVIVDPRRFGTGELLLGEPALERFFAARLGVEPLQEAFTARAPARDRARARGADQGVPARPAPDRGRRQHLRRRGAVSRAHPSAAPGGQPDARAVRAAARCGRSRRCSAGIDARGASIDDFRHVDGVRGAFQDQFLVHLREGEPCVRCGTTIVKMVVGGRGTYVCEHCQPRPRLRRQDARRGAAAAQSRAPRAVRDAESSGARSGGEQLVEAPLSAARLDLGVAAEQLLADEHLREAHHPGALRQLDAPGGVLARG